MKGAASSWKTRQRKRKTQEDKADPKDVRITIRLSSVEERQELERDAAAIGLTPPAFLLSTWKVARMRPKSEMPKMLEDHI
jgi:hypothetical protein